MYTEKEYATPNVYHSAGALETTSQVTTSAARLLGFIASNNSGATGWIQVFDKASAPSASAVPIVSVRVATGDQTSFNAAVFNCINCHNGIAIALSSTEATYTAVSNQMFCTAFYI